MPESLQWLRHITIALIHTLLDQIEFGPSCSDYRLRYQIQKLRYVLILPLRALLIKEATLAKYPIILSWYCEATPNTLHTLFSLTVWRPVRGINVTSLIWLRLDRETKLGTTKLFNHVQRSLPGSMV